MKALEKDRNRRYETANGLALDIQRYLADEPVQACPPSAGYRLRKYARKYKKVLATVGAFAALLVAATAISIGLASWALAERNHAEEQKQAAEANFKRALEAVDQMLTRVGEAQLLHVPQMEPVRRDLLQDALRFYQEFLRERGDNPLVRSEAAKAYRRVGQIQVLLGQRDEGEEAYRQAVSCWRSCWPNLRTIRPSSTNWPASTTIWACFTTPPNDGLRRRRPSSRPWRFWSSWNASIRRS